MNENISGLLRSHRSIGSAEPKVVIGQLSAEVTHTSPKVKVWKVKTIKCSIDNIIMSGLLVAVMGFHKTKGSM